MLLRKNVEREGRNSKLAYSLLSMRVDVGTCQKPKQMLVFLLRCDWIKNAPENHAISYVHKLGKYQSPIFFFLKETILSQIFIKKYK